MELKEILFEKYNMYGEDIDASLDYFKIENIKKNFFFLKEGKISGKLGYLKSGILRSYFINENGDEITSHFFVPGNVVVSIDSFNNQNPSKENIIAVEDSEFLMISFNKMQELFKTLPIWKQIAKDVSEIKFNNMMNRSIMLQTLSAGERYSFLVQNNPDIIQKVALKHIASYLGIDIATLSRIRKKQ